MFFTQDDYKKIQQWLIKNSVKDTEFNEANIPFNGEETITIVQGNQNKKVFLKDLIAQVFNLGISDFVNITDKYDAPNISLEEAIRLIPSRARKEGQVITFLDMEDHWHIYQFKGALNQWNVLDTWEDLFDWEKLIIDSILPDEEDLTKSEPDTNGNSYLSLKDREYNPEDFSGLGRIILRKNIMEVEDPIYGKVKKNTLYQDMFTQSNTIYEIRYDFDLNGAEITIPEGCVLDFQGGSLSNGTMEGNNTAIKAELVKIFGLDLNILGNWNVAEVYPEWFGAIGDNSCDDYEPITKCMYSVLSHKIRLSKLYKISKGLLYQHDIDKDNKYNRSLSFVGNSKEDTGFYLYNESEIKPVIQIFGNGASFENLLIKGAKVSEDWSDYNKRIEAHGIDLRNCKYPTYVNNCKIINCSSCGIMAIGTSGGRFTNNIIYNVYGEAILNSIQGWSTVIANNILGSSNSPRMKWGIDSNVKNTEIRSNVIYNVEVGITFENMNHNEQDTSYDNNTFNGIIEGNIIYNSSFCGINISTANHVNLVRNVLVTNNLILPDYNLEVYGEGLGIAFENVEHIVISNNKITATKIQQEYVYPNTCIGVKAASIGKDILIENNVFSGFQRFGISLYDQNYSYDDRDEIKNITIKNNIFNNIKAAAIQTREKCSNVFIANNMSYETNTIQIVGEIKGFAHFQGNIAIGDGVTPLFNALNTDYKQHETIFDVKNEEELPLDVNKSRIITAYTQNGINHYYDNAWRRFDGYPISLKTIGAWDERPDTSLIKKGYLYYDTTSYRLMIYRGLNANDWICVDDGRKTHAFALSDNDNQRPELQYGHRGLSVFDSSINKPIWWTGTKWVDATGANV